MSASCTINKCGKPIVARGFCRTHYNRWWSVGDPLMPRKPRQKTPAVLFIEALACASRAGCIDWPYDTDGVGYGRLTINGRRVGAHRRVCEVYQGPAPTQNHQAAHSCGRRICVNPHHIRWATQRENEADKLAHGRSAHGANNGCAKLCAQDVIEIRASTASGAALARKFGVRDGQISRIRKGQRWAHLE